MATYLEQSLEKLKEFEGSISWMYRDTAGKVTVAVGLMLPNSEAACLLPFQVQGRPARREEIGGDFARVNAMAPGHPAAFYRAWQGLELMPEEMNSLLLRVLTGFEGGLRERLPGYDALPDPVKMVLLDMAYNLGLGGLFHGYPKMIAAIEAKDWALAAEQCARHGIGEARNAWAKTELLSGAVVDKLEASIENDPLWKKIAFGALGVAVTWFERSAL
jgi:GH24 family phage-related lysozyme (muramidase)